MGHTGVNGKSSNEAHLIDAKSKRLGRPISAPLLTDVRAPAGYPHHS